MEIKAVTAGSLLLVDGQALAAVAAELGVADDLEAFSLELLAEVL